MAVQSMTGHRVGTGVCMDEIESKSREWETETAVQVDLDLDLPIRSREREREVLDTLDELPQR
jgi:hypothetical protein